MEEEGHFFYFYLSGAGQVSAKMFLLVGHPFPSPLLVGTGFSQSFVCTCLLLVQIRVSAATCPGYIDNSKETQGTHQHLDP